MSLLTLFWRFEMLMIEVVWMIFGISGVLVFGAYLPADGPVASGIQAFYWQRQGYGFVRDGLVGGLLGGIGAGDEVDVASAQFFVNSSLAPVHLFRRRVKSVADVLKGIRQHVFSQSRWDVLFRYWGSVFRHGPCGLVRTLWSLGCCMDSFGGSLTLWVCSMTLLGGLWPFVGNLTCIAGLAGCGADLLYAWLRPDLVPPSPFLVIKDADAQTSQILVKPHLNDAEFRKACMPFFCRSGYLVVAVQ